MEPLKKAPVSMYNKICMIICNILRNKTNNIKEKMTPDGWVLIENLIKIKEINTYVEDQDQIKEILETDKKFEFTPDKLMVRVKPKKKRVFDKNTKISKFL